MSHSPPTATNTTTTTLCRPVLLCSPCRNLRFIAEQRLRRCCANGGVLVFFPGTKESKRYLPLGGGQHHRLAGFLDRSIQSRIGIRILIENQVALASQARKTRDERDGYVGVRQLR